MSVEPGDLIKFVRQKDYIAEKVLGQGGTGQAVLLQDDVLGMQFVCKVYSPQQGNDLDECFQRFIDEIKILYLLAHKNVVRIFNYFLYPSQKKGYILMEYVKGQSLDESMRDDPLEEYDGTFEQIIEGFSYLEKNKILHRDIRPSNILVDDHGTVKIIDFGFGKKIEANEIEALSMRLNWPVSKEPQEIEDGIYNNKTEMYFIAKMFDGILRNNNYNSFRYQDILDKMMELEPDRRPSSFAEILEMMSNNILRLTDFSAAEKQTYKSFADSLLASLCDFTNSPRIITNTEFVFKNLENLISACGIETVLPNNSDLIDCFVKGDNYTFYQQNKIPFEQIKQLYIMLKRFPNAKREVVIRSIAARLRTVEIKKSDDLPFDL